MGCRALFPRWFAAQDGDKLGNGGIFVRAIGGQDDLIPLLGTEGQDFQDAGGIGLPGGLTDPDPRAEPARSPDTLGCRSSVKACFQGNGDRSFDHGFPSIGATVLVV